MALLSIRNVDAYIGNVQVLHDVSLDVEEGKIVSIIGRNGAGKTRVIRTVMGLMKPSSGRVMFNGEDITGMPPHVIARKGIGLAPDYRGVFVDLTVEENILMPKWIVGSKTLKEREDKNFEDVIYKIFPELEAMRNRKGLLLSGGEGKMLAIARALMLRPRLLLLDAPLEGLAPVAVNRIAEGLKNIQGYGVSMLVAECNIDLATRLSKEIYVIERGEIVYGGDAGEFLRQKELIKLVRGY